MAQEDDEDSGTSANAGFVVEFKLMLTSLDNIGTLHIKISVSTLNWIIKNSIAFSNLKNFDYHVIKQEVGKFVFKINVTPNRLRE